MTVRKSLTDGKKSAEPIHLESLRSLRAILSNPATRALKKEFDTGEIIPIQKELVHLILIGIVALEKSVPTPSGTRALCVREYTANRVPDALHLADQHIPDTSFRLVAASDVILLEFHIERDARLLESLRSHLFRCVLEQEGEDLAQILFDRESEVQQAQRMLTRELKEPATPPLELEKVELELEEERTARLYAEELLAEHRKNLVASRTLNTQLQTKIDHLIEMLNAKTAPTEMTHPSMEDPSIEVGEELIPAVEIEAHQSDALRPEQLPVVTGTFNPLKTLGYEEPRPDALIIEEPRPVRPVLPRGNLQIDWSDLSDKK